VWSRIFSNQNPVGRVIVHLTGLINFPIIGNDAANRNMSKIYYYNQSFIYIYIISLSFRVMVCVINLIRSRNKPV
jgi:hypothetical protein